MSRFWSPMVHNLEPYIPGEQPKLARLNKLNTNENPYGPSPKVIEAIKQQLDDNLRLYPDPDARVLKQAIADNYHLRVDQVFVGNGSDEVLAHVFQALFQQSQPILFPDISYSFYPVYCGLYQIDFEKIPLADDFSLQITDYQQPNGGIIFANPNAPTGRIVDLSQIEMLLNLNRDSVVVVDEAYIDFGGESAVELIDQYPNLLVTQTMSKSRSLAGLRIGYAMGDKAIIEALTRVKDSFNSYPVDSLAIAAGVAAMKDTNHFETCRQRVIVDREQLIASLEQYQFEVLPSSANFVFATHPEYKASDLAKGLREKGIFIRYFTAKRIQHYIRITVGTQQQNAQLIEVLAELLGR